MDRLEPHGDWIFTNCFLAIAWLGGVLCWQCTAILAGILHYFDLLEHYIFVVSLRGGFCEQYDHLRGTAACGHNAHEHGGL